MSIADVGRTRFVDGMRVAREHLDHLQDVLLEAAAHGRTNAGAGKVCFGLRVQDDGAGGLSVGPGVAFDRGARLLSVDAPVALTPDWAGGTRLHLVAVHVLRSEGVVDGIPTLLFDDTGIEARSTSPPYTDDAVVFAQLDRGTGGAVTVTQRGEWYLPPHNHTHSGRFLTQDGLWRFDGQPLAFPPARFDSGFVAVAPGERIELAHGLGTADALVQLQAREGERGRVTTAGHGARWWYEIDPERIALARAEDQAGDLRLRAVAWPLDPAAAAGPLLPLADPGADRVVAPGESFVLDGSGSRAFGGHALTTFIWTKTT